MYFKRHDVKQKSNISSPYLARTSKRLRDQLNFNSSYHLETEGPTLKVNQILKNVVQVFFKVPWEMGEQLTFKGIFSQ